MASIERRERNGKVTYSVRYRSPDGASKRKVFGRRVDARRFMSANEESKQRGAWVDPAAGKVTFGTLAEEWFENKPFKKPTTKHMYRQLLNNKIFPTFEHVPVATITTTKVEDWIAALVNSGLSPSRVRSATNVLGQVLGRAVKEDRLARNSAKGIDRETLPKLPRSERHFLSSAEVERLAAAIDPRYRLLVLFDAYTGLRAGECAALRVKHLNVLKGIVTVRESVAEVDGRLEWGLPKSYEQRTVRLPRFLRDELAAYLVERPHGPEDLVFTAQLGGPLRQSQFMARFYKPAVERSGLPEGLRFHDLRHTAASLAISTGANILAVSKMLGHADASITLKVYGHLYPSDADALADRLDDVRAAACGPTVAPSSPTVATAQVSALRSVPG